MDETLTAMPAGLEILEPGNEVKVTIREGKFHQIKRMFHAVGSEITYLERVTFAGFELDTSLARGEWRELSADEINTLLEYNKTR